MIKIGDIVKVTSTTIHQGKRREFIPIGTICRVVDTAHYENDSDTVGIVPEKDFLDYSGCGEFWYLESEVEKGHMEWIKEKDEKKCYVLTCHCYSGDDSILVFWNESDAYKAMIKELETEITNLQREGYALDSSENDNSAEVHVPDGNIYYEWNIEESTIR